MGSSASVPADKHIVIIGCGYGGKELALALIKLNANVTVVDAKEYFHHNVASVRAVVEEDYARKMFIPYAPTFGDHFRKGKVTGIDVTAKKVSLEGGDVISYDVLIIATGSTGPMKEWTLSREDAVKKYSHYSAEVNKSKSIVLIGGGAVGTEIAAEIGTDFPHKKVTLIHGGAQLVLPNAPSNFTCKVNCIVKQMNIHVILNELVENLADLPDGVHGSYQVKTNKGSTVDADLVIKATGLKVNTTAYANSLADHMNDSGTLRVNEFLQVDGCKDVFAIGDCTDASAAKLAYVAILQAQYLATNLPKQLNGLPMQPWSNDCIKYLIGLSMGRNRGVVCTVGGWMLPEFIIVYAKSRDMMLARFYSEMNQKIPESK